MTRAAAAVFLFFCGMSLSAQSREVFIDWTTFLSEYLADSPPDDGDDEAGRAEARCRRLEQLAAAPLDLNRATRDDLLELPFLSRAQADSLLAYRLRRGRFVTPGELMFVSGLDVRTRRWLSLFVRTDEPAGPGATLRRRLFRGRHRLETRLDVPLYARAADRNGSADYVAAHPRNAFLGNRLAHIARYRYDEPDGHVRYGLTLEKDAGEPFGRYGARPYDYVSAYFLYRPPSRRWTLLAGDFDAHFGQGLLLGGGFLPGKRVITSRGGLGRAAFGPHTSADECRFFRGLAGEMRLGNFALQLFGSLGRRDATPVGADSVSAFDGSGLHRSAAERARRRNTRVSAFGARLGWSVRNLKLALGGYGACFDRTFAPPLRPYNRYYLRGRSAGGIEADYRVGLRRAELEGEVALDGRGHPAMLHMLRLAPRDGLSVLFSVRSYSPRFVSVFGRTLSESSHLQNERGLLSALNWVCSRRLALEAGADFFRFPRPSWRASGPAQGLEAWAEVRTSPSGGLALALRYRFRTRPYDVTGREGLMVYNQTHRLRLSAGIGRRKAVSVGLDGVCHADRLAPARWGGMFSVRGATSPERRFRLTAFGALFAGGRSSTALYAFEPVLRDQYGLVAYRGRGFSLAVAAGARLARGLSAGARVAWLHYFDRRTQGSGPTRVDSPDRPAVSLQLQWAP